MIGAASGSAGTTGAPLGMPTVLDIVGLKVICMSGYTDDALARHGVPTPGVAFLRNLEQKLRDVLGRPGRVV